MNMYQDISIQKINYKKRKTTVCNSSLCILEPIQKSSMDQAECVFRGGVWVGECQNLCIDTEAGVNMLAGLDMCSET